jgi:hypothetical protein
MEITPFYPPYFKGDKDTNIWYNVGEVRADFPS